MSNDPRFYIFALVAIVVLSALMMGIAILWGVL